jgi:hypothetical protein
LSQCGELFLSAWEFNYSLDDNFTYSPIHKWFTFLAS